MCFEKFLDGVSEININIAMYVQKASPLRRVSNIVELMYTFK